MSKTRTADEIAWEKEYGNGAKMPPPGVETPAPERVDDRPALTLYRLTPKDRQEPPFHFAGVAQLFIVAALSERQARMFAADGDALGAGAWLNDAKTDCVEFAPTEAGIVARDIDGR